MGDGRQTTERRNDGTTERRNDDGPSSVILSAVRRVRIAFTSAIDVVP